MTVEVFEPADIALVQGVGPYEIPHPYAEGSILASVAVDGLVIPLAAADYAVAPADSAIRGDLYLSAAAAALHAGRRLIITRETLDEQGWLGLLGERERGLERQMDLLTMGLQEVRGQVQRSMRSTTPLQPFDPADGEGRALIVQDGHVFPGPTAIQIAAAQGFAEASQAAAIQAQDAAVQAQDAVDRGAGTPSFTDRAAAGVAAIPMPAGQIIVAGVIYTRDPGGTLTTGDGAKWTPVTKISPQTLGADGIGGDASAAIAAMQAHLSATGGAVTVPKGSYLLAGTTYDIDHEAVIHKASGIAVNLLASARNNAMLFVVDTPDDPVLNHAHARVPISVTVRGRGAQHASGVRSNLVNHSTDGQGNTAFYGNATSYPTALWSAALHGETRHAGGTAICLNLEAASFTMKGSFYGAVISNTTANGHVSHPFGSPAVGHPGATAVLIQGTVQNAASGGWALGLDFSPTSMRLGGTDIRIRTTSARHIHVEADAPASAADILLEANSANGLALRGSYSGSAISIPAMQKIGLDPTGGIGVRYNNTLNRVEFLNGETVRGYVDMAAGSGVKMN